MIVKGVSEKSGFFLIELPIELPIKLPIGWPIGLPIALPIGLPIGVGGRGEACKPGSAKDRKAHLYTLPFMQETLQTVCKAIEDRQQKQASRQQNPIGNPIGN